MTDLIDKISNVWDKTLTDIANGIKKRKGKIAIGLSILGVVAGIEAAKNLRTHESACETYQGYSIIKDDGEYIYVFDPKRIEERNPIAPKYAASGDPELRYSLERGKRYCFTIEKSYLPLPENRIISIKPDNSVCSEARGLGN